MKFTLNLLHRLLTVVLIAAALNVILLMAHGSEYDFHLGPLHLVAHGAFKPLLILNTAFLLAVLAAPLRRTRKLSLYDESQIAETAPLLVFLTLPALAFSCFVNPLYDEWNYRGLSSTYPSLAGAVRLFGSSQIGVWYRPLGFVSLWLDRALFDGHVWAYHLQNIALHCANAALVSLLAHRLGLSRLAARWAGVLFLAAAITYEPVMWPSARFDLWAMLFTLLALLASARFLTGSNAATLAAALGCYALAVCSKESGYAFPILLTVMALAWPIGAKPPDRVRRMLQLGVGVGLVTAAMLAIREAVLGGAGGYPGTSTTPSIHLSFSAATIRIVLARAMQLSTFAVNFGHPTPAAMLAVVSLFAALLAVAVLAGASAPPRARMLVVYLFAAVVPVAPLISWLDFNAQHVRYLYMPAAFVAMLAAAALSNARNAARYLFAFGALNLCGGFYNTWVYRTTYAHSTNLARQIAADVNGQNLPRVTIVGMPPEYNGVLFSQFELQYRLQQMRPDVNLVFQDHGSCGDAACYIWQPGPRALVRFPAP